MSKTWLPLQRERTLQRAPWGYYPAAEDSLTLLPNIDQLNVLEEGLKLADEGVSWDRVAAYVTQKSGKSISDATVRKYYETDPSRDEQRAVRDKLTGNYKAAHLKRKKLTKEQKIVKEIINAKKSIAHKNRALEKIKAEKEQDTSVPLELADQPEVPYAEPKPEILPANENVIRPNPGPQTDFLAASEREVLFGGAAGGGKSHAIIIDPLRTAHMESHRAITFRRTNDELRDLIDLSKDIYPKAIPGAKFQEQKSTWIFPSGGTHWFRYLDRDDDVKSHQGQAFTHIDFDELTQWGSPFVYNYMRSRLRTKDKKIRPYLSIRATTNPGGSGHAWVKKMFIDPAPPNTAFPARDLETDQVLVFPPGHEQAGQPLFYRRFIPSKLKDNPYLTQDSDYEANLLSLPEIERKQLLEGNWDIVEGAAFSEFRRDHHICAPFEVPSHWKRFRGGDWGYTDPHAVYWLAEDDYGRIFVYREQYAKLINSADLADKIVAAESGENILYGMLDSSCWHVRDSTPSTADVMRSRGCFWRQASRAPGTRISRKQELHRRLQLKEYKDKDTGKPFLSPGIIIFSTCTNLIRTLPSLPLDKNNPEDVDTDAEDHGYDALTYALVSRPMHRNNIVVRQTMSAAPLERSYDSFGFPK